MKVLVLEYITGGGLRQETIPPSLACEGEQMLRALTDDLLELPGVELVVFRDNRLNARLVPRETVNLETVDVGEADDFQTLWLEWIARCDAVWPIAPETGGILEHLCRDVATSGKALLNSPPEAVRLAASKLETARRLGQHGLPVAPTVPLNEWAALMHGYETEGSPDSAARHPGCVVIKPDDGVGCEGAHIVRKPTDFTMPPNVKNWIAQPLLEGDSLSLSALFAHGKARLLSCNRQLVARTGGGFVLQGCLVNAIPDVSRGWQTLAGAIARALPELWGYAGVDLILTDTGPRILEINPRLTTSYTGLRAATGENPAAWVLDLLRTGQLPRPRGRYGKAVEISLEKSRAH